VKNETPSLSAIEAELARQNAALESFEQDLRSLGDVELAVSPAFLEAFEEATTLHTNNACAFLGIRG
jgi:hypothetical protein